MAAITAAVLGLTTAGSASAATVTVDETSLGNGWNAVVAGQGTTAFVNAADSPLPGGALQLDTNADNADKAALYTTLNQGTPVSSITDLGYWTKAVEQSNAAGTASYQLEIDLDGDLATTADQLFLVYEPYWQDAGIGDPDPVVSNTWQQWDVEAGLFWASKTVGGFTNGMGGPPFYTLQEIKEKAGPSALVKRIGTNLGTYNPGYTVLVDGLTFNGTQYDFQPRAFTKDGCKDGGWAVFAEPFVNQGDCVSYFASNGKTHS